MNQMSAQAVLEKIKKGESLSGYDLSGLDLSGLELNWADFFKANLSWARLGGVKMQKANLAQANICWADFSNADLQGSNLREACLQEGNFRGGNLSGADLSGADLSWAKCPKADLSHADFSQANLSQGNFSLSDLRGAKFIGADLSGADLALANLTGGKFDGARLSGANLSGATLAMCRFPDADLRGANLTGAKICGAWFAPDTRLEEVVCEWYDLSPDGDGSDVRRPGDKGFKNIVSVLDSRIIIYSRSPLGAELFAGLYGLSKALRVLKTRVSKVEETPDGGCALTFEASREENLIPAVLVFFNALVQDGKLDIQALGDDLGNLNRIVVNGRPLMDLLKEAPYLVDTSLMHYGMLEKFRRGFSSMQAMIRGESISIRRNGSRLYFDYRSPLIKPRNEHDYSAREKDDWFRGKEDLVNIATGVGIARVFKQLLANTVLPAKKGAE